MEDSVKPIFSLNNASRHWGEQHSLHDLTLDISAGDCVALIGPSGSGKSTLIKLMAGALRASSGRVLIDGRNIQDLTHRQLRAHRARCRIIEQDHLLVPQLSVHQNVVAGLLSQWSALKTIAAFLWPMQKKQVAALLSSLGIEDKQWQKVGELSGGEMQRVSIARALISKPDVILADEPTASLDPVTAEAVTRLLVDQAKLRKITLVFCTHWLANIMPYCNRILGLREGRLFLSGAPSEIDAQALDHLYQGSDERI